MIKSPDANIDSASSEKGFKGKLEGFMRIIFLIAVLGSPIATTACNVEAGEVDVTSSVAGPELETDPSLEIAPNLENDTSYYLEHYSQVFNDKSAFTGAVPGVTPNWYSNSEESYNIRQQILAIENPRERVLAADAYFDVMGNDRYRFETNGGSYSCNVYAREFLLFLLGDMNFAGIYKSSNGEPYYIWDNNSELINNSNYPAFSANNIDWWMKNYGTGVIHADNGKDYSPGWIKVNKNQLEAYIKSGNYIGVAVTNEAVIQKDPTYIGHVSLFIPGAKRDEWGRTQATNNYAFNTDMSLIFNNVEEDFQYYVHKIENRQSFE